jgi:RHS repeat-associated protein
VDELGNVTVYQYDSQSRLSAVLYPWTEEKSAADKQEAAEAGLFFSNEKGNPERYSIQLSDLARMRELLNRYAYDRGPLVAYNQILWRETYAYDANGNRASKTTPWGKITYAYDAENRLVKKGYIAYTYDKDGNLLSETGGYREAHYEYNGQNRMAYSEVRNKEKNTIATSKYMYDAYGRRTIAQDEGRSAMRTLYDGFTFEVIRESEAFNSGSFTVSGVQQAVTPTTPERSSERLSRHRLVTEGYSTWLGDSAPQPQSSGQHSTAPAPEYHYAGINVTLYANGEAVAINRYSTQNFTGGTAYLGKDVLGSVGGVSNEWGQLEERYEYDAFGKPYKGDLTTGMNLGYTGKPYGITTGMYNYGYRDYQPEAARFTTVDPIRDGNNWFAYVNNDPVNWVDPAGLEGKITNNSNETILVKTEHEDEKNCEFITVSPGATYNGDVDGILAPDGNTYKGYSGSQVTVTEKEGQYSFKTTAGTDFMNGAGNVAKNIIKDDAEQYGIYPNRGAGYSGIEGWWDNAIKEEGQPENWGVFEMKLGTIIFLGISFFFNSCEINLSKIVKQIEKYSVVEKVLFVKEETVDFTNEITVGIRLKNGGNIAIAHLQADLKTCHSLITEIDI